MNVKQQFAIVDAFLKHEFGCHKKIEKSLTHERDVNRELMKLINDVKFSKFSKMNFLSKNFQFDVLFRKNQNMRAKFYDSNHQMKNLKHALKSKQDCIKIVEKKMKSVIKKLEEQNKDLKSEFMSYITKNDDINIETTTTKKKIDISVFREV